MKSFEFSGVEPSLYAKYYLELNYAFKEMMNSINVADRTEMWDWEPISKFTKIVLERKFKQSGRCVKCYFFCFL